jgi:hypothetical protein
MQFVVFIVHSSMDPPVHPLCVEPPKLVKYIKLEFSGQKQASLAVGGGAWGGGGFYNGYTDRPPSLSVVKHMRQLVAL